MAKTKYTPKQAAVVLTNEWLFGDEGVDPRSMDNDDMSEILDMNVTPGKAEKISDQVDKLLEGTVKKRIDKNLASME